MTEPTTSKRRPHMLRRGSEMSETIAFRGTPKDRAELRIWAMEQGVDLSTALRLLLIREKILSPQ